MNVARSFYTPIIVHKSFLNEFISILYFTNSSVIRLKIRIKFFFIYDNVITFCSSSNRQITLLDKLKDKPTHYRVRRLIIC